jgi:hypothetical protein
MLTFKIENNDLVLDGQNNLAMVDKVDEVVQCIDRIITTQLGEWLLDPEHGLEYGYIRGKNIDIDRAKLEFTKAIVQEERVERVENINIVINDQLRTVTITFECTLKDGSTIREVKEIE